MSLAKYMQLYKEHGFFNGSTVRVRIPDTSFFGSDLILSKDGQVLRTRTINDDVVDFFTDESGTLVLSADNGTSTLSGEVKISAYGTYNITLSGTSTDKSREVYASKDVTLDENISSDTVAIGYTGDLSRVSAVSSNTSVATVSVNGNKVTVKDAGKDFNGKATITATVEATTDYDAGEVNFYVNKLTGSYGTWADGSDEVVSRMIAEADAGEINLADFWQIGETRRVHLDAIEAGTAVAAQPEQDIDLVIMHNATGNSYYPLTTPLDSGKAYPNFVIGTKDCLERPSAMAYIANTITSQTSSLSYSNTSYVTVSPSGVSELIEYLNNSFVNSLPKWIQQAIKAINRRYLCATGSGSFGANQAAYSTIGTKSNKVSIPAIREVGFNSNITYKSFADVPDGIGVYRRTGSYYIRNQEMPATYIVNWTNGQINNNGSIWQYFENSKSKSKKQGLNGANIDYFVNDTFMLSSHDTWSGTYRTNLSMAFYIDANGELQTNNLDAEEERIKLRGISPIMFI